MNQETLLNLIFFFLGVWLRLILAVFSIYWNRPCESRPEENSFSKTDLQWPPLCYTALSESYPDDPMSPSRG